MNVLPIRDGQIIGIEATTDHPKHRKGPALRSIRTQGAALFALLAILVSGILTGIAIAYQDTDANQNSLESLLTWQYEAAQIDAISRGIVSDTILWNNALLAGDSRGTEQMKQQIDDEILSVRVLDARIAALPLPIDAYDVRKTYSAAILALATQMETFLTTGIHTDDQTLVAAALARAAWHEAGSQVYPFITAQVKSDLADQVARRAYVSKLLIGGGVLATLMIGLLALVLFRLTLKPIAGLARVATTLASGRSATIKSTDRTDEIGQLTMALAAWQESLGGEVVRLRSEVAESATTLAVSAQELASATSDQTTAATATSVSMELLAHSSASIADTIDRAAIKADQTRESLELAQVDLRASGDRTIALAARVNEVEGILEVINGIADQTNLLALNAAIEAARAGDAGRGFAVVADEVRRLAERTKAAAGDIATLVHGAQTQISDTVVALEKRVKQMERALVMMKEMAALSTQVQLSTQQQRSATAQVMDAIDHIAEGSRSVATTAQNMASAAARQGELASDLAGSNRTGSHETTPAKPLPLRRPA